MKPTHQITSPLPGCRTFPKTDWNYQSTLDAARATAIESKGVKLLPIWKLSSGFFGAEAGREYAAEFFLFSVMASMSAWPILLAIYWIPRM